MNFENILFKKEFRGTTVKDGKTYKKYKKVPRFKSIKKILFILLAAEIVFIIIAAVIILHPTRKPIRNNAPENLTSGITEY
ncbi:MAG: hypothetical protein HZC15_03515 [Candidatus Omnitrophica bacterium]|nr:hypothetical protein [Candidatus Omnitrophota bacterium]